MGLQEKTMLKIFLFCVLTLEIVRSESVNEDQYGEKRSARGQDICKYNKGPWSSCQQLTQIETRDDVLRPDVSSPACPLKRQITRNCKKDNRKSQRTTTKKGLCVYDKAKEADWTECESGVRKKTLKLVVEKDHAGCPPTKVIAKKCKTPKTKKEKKEKKIKKEKKEKKEKKKERKEAKKKKQEKRENKISEKCEFSTWSEYSPCKDGVQQRQRKVMRGNNVKLCMRQATQKKKC